MIPGTSALRFQQFDTAAFGIPFYRVNDPGSPVLAKEIAALADEPSFIVDAKLPADDLAGSARLIKLGFRKVCVQIELHHDLKHPIVQPSNIQIRRYVILPEDTIRAHAAQFVFNRFAQDFELPPEGHQQLYEQWIRNSLQAGAHSIAIEGYDFITFKDELMSIKLDLVSVLRKKQGIASNLVGAILHHAQKRNAQDVRVVTECENLPAVRLYMKTGFVPFAFFAVFHLCQLRNKLTRAANTTT